jgi:hypothetical protein
MKKTLFIVIFLAKKPHDKEATTCVAAARLIRRE